ncbi:MAG: DUF192 domain-containing protein [Bacteroidota bacterium]
MSRKHREKRKVLRKKQAKDVVKTKKNKRVIFGLLLLIIAYADENNKIVTIHKYTKPSSKSNYPSYDNAMYVVEVNAGFCDRHQIKEGDLIQFKQLIWKQ